MSFPFLATITTAPRKLPSSTSFLSAAPIFASRELDMPTDSGFATGSGGLDAASAANETRSASETIAPRVLSVRFMVTPPRLVGVLYGLRYHGEERMKESGRRRFLKSIPVIGAAGLSAPVFSAEQHAHPTSSPRSQAYMFLTEP